MGKGKHKRKRERRQQQANQQAANAGLHKQEVVATKAKDNPTDNSDQQRASKQEFTMDWGRVGRFMSNPAVTNWLLTIFTGALVGVAIQQRIVMTGQLDDMRKDQRPWIKVRFPGLEPVRPNAPLAGNLVITNSGKTPARNISAEIVIEKVVNGEEPKLDYPQPHGGFTTGILFPGEPADPVRFIRTRYTGHGTDWEEDHLTPDEVQQFAQGKIFFVSYATVTYSDYFGIKHWTRLCTAHVQTITTGNFTAQKCTNYGDIDTN